MSIKYTPPNGRIDKIIFNLDNKQLLLAKDLLLKQYPFAIIIYHCYSSDCGEPEYLIYPDGWSEAPIGIGRSAEDAIINTSKVNSKINPDEDLDINQNFNDSAIQLLSERVAALERKSKFPPPELTWLYTHCKAIGMNDKSSSGNWEEDICQFTIELKNRAEKAEQELFRLKKCDCKNYDHQVCDICMGIDKNNPMKDNN